MRPYEISDLAKDLVEMARYLLAPGGRLVFFLPTVSEDYSEVDLPVCEGMSVVGNSVQNFGKWGRRVGLLRAGFCWGGTDPNFYSTTAVDYNAEGRARRRCS